MSRWMSATGLVWWRDEAHVLSTEHPLFQRIVVGISAEGTPAALALAKALAPPEAVFVLVHVEAGKPVHGVLPSDGATDAAAGISDALSLLERARHQLGEPCEIVVETTTTVAHGLHAVAEREEADLLVVASSDAPSEADSTLPSVLHHAPCAVAIADHGRGAEPLILKRVGLAYRPSAAGLHAAAIARRIADASSAEFHATTVVPVLPNPWLGPAVSGVQVLATLDGTLAGLAQHDLDALTDVIDHVVEGDPIQALLRFGATVDLLVVGSRSAGPLRRMFTGSTADALASAAPTALLVVSAHDEAAVIGDA